MRVNVFCNNLLQAKNLKDETMKRVQNLDVGRINAPHPLPSILISEHPDSLQAQVRIKESELSSA